LKRSLVLHTHLVIQTKAEGPAFGAQSRKLDLRLSPE
jgi:hypothetical protein